MQGKIDSRLVVLTEKVNECDKSFKKNAKILKKSIFEDRMASSKEIDEICELEDKVSGITEEYRGVIGLLSRLYFKIYNNRKVSSLNDYKKSDIHNKSK